MTFQDRKSVRYDLAQPELMLSTLCVEGGVSVEMILNNISAGGLQIIAPDRVRKGDVIRVCLHFKDRTVVDSTAIVRWAIIDGQGWVAGCQFEESLAAGVLDDLAESGVLERRRHFRIPVLLEAKVAFEGSPEKQNCRIVDYSNGGICIQASGEPQRGQKARVSVSDAGEKAEVYVVVQWHNSDTNQIGLEFLREDDREAFLNCVELLV